MLAALVVGLGFVWLFWPVLFEGKNFSFRDAGHYYYPLFQSIQAEWNEGRVPLWSEQQNGGQSIAANPTTAVFYPPKLVFFVLPYALAFKTYVLMHWWIALGSCVACARFLGADRWGAYAGGFAYASSGFVLFQTSNLVYHCGAAWIPLGALFGIQLLRGPRMVAFVGLAFSLAMQVLCGDVQTAYCLGGALACYAIIASKSRVRTGVAMLVAIGGICFSLSQSGTMSESRTLFLMASGVSLATGIGFMLSDRSSYIGLGWLSLAGLLAGGLSAIQLLPAMELVSLAERSQTLTRDELLRFSFSPEVVFDFAIPRFFADGESVFGRWFVLTEGEAWVSSNYLGFASFSGMILFAFRQTRRPIDWFLFGFALICLGLSFGRHLEIPFVLFGDEKISLYDCCRTLVPGFGNWRYPSKLLVFCAFAIAVLGAIQWNQSLDYRINRWWVVLGSGVAVVSLAIVFVAFNGEDTARTRAIPATIHTGVVALALTVIACCRDRRFAGVEVHGVLLLLAVVGDVSFANQPLVLADEQSDLDRKSEIAQLIREDHDASASAEAPFRIHVATNYLPARLSSTGTPWEAVNHWKTRTMQFLHVLADGHSITHRPQTIERFEKQLQFGLLPFDFPRPDGQLTLYYHPRNALDRWNTKYFIVPANTDPRIPERTALTLLADSKGKPHTVIASSPPGEDDFQIIRNENALPRAWVVHQIDLRSQIDVSNLQERAARVMQLNSSSNILPNKIPNPFGGGTYPIREVVMLESDRPSRDWEEFSPGGVPGPNEGITFTDRLANHIKCNVTLDRPGIAVFCDSWYPGWQAKVDGQPAEILYVNCGMRGLALKAGDHRIELTYRPTSVRLGALLSCVSLGFLVFLLYRNSRMYSSRRERLELQEQHDPAVTDD